jgi:hypothetical protein
VAAEAPLPGVGRLLQEPERRRLYLPIICRIGASVVMPQIRPI